MIDFEVSALVLKYSVFITLFIMSILKPHLDELARSYNRQLNAGGPGLLSLLEGLSPLFRDESHTVFDSDEVASLLDVAVFLSYYVSVLPWYSSQRRQL